MSGSSCNQVGEPDKNPRPTAQTPDPAASAAGEASRRKSLRVTDSACFINRALWVAVLLLLAAVAPRETGYDAGADGPVKFRSRRAASFLGENEWLLQPVAALGFGVLGLFGYRCFRQWQAQRSFQRFRSNQEIRDTRVTTAWWWRVFARRRQTERGKLRRSSSTFRAPGAAGIPSARVPVVHAKSSSPARGVVDLHAEDEAHEIFVDGEFKGMTPARLSLGAGPHLIEMKRPGHPSHRRLIAVTNDGEVSLMPFFDENFQRSVPAPRRRLSRAAQREPGIGEDPARAPTGGARSLSVAPQDLAGLGTLFWSF